MMKNTGEIQPSQKKLLSDAKETIKLLTEPETEGVTKIHKRLAYEGMEARFSCVEESKGRNIGMPLANPAPAETVEPPTLEWKRIEERLNDSNSLCKEMGMVLERIEQRLFALEKRDGRPSAQGIPTSPPVNMTVFQVDQRLFGIPSDQIVRLFKVSEDGHGHFQHQQRIRLKDFEVKIVDLKKILAFQEEGGKRATRILVMKIGEDYKGLMIERIVKHFSAYPEIKDGYGEYFSGMVRWIDESHPVDVPILDLTKC